MKDKNGKILYIGKAGNLQRRVASYFERPQDARILRMVSKIAKVDFQKTETVIEALILEAELIKRYLPEYNIKDKDDKSFLWMVVTREKFPRVLTLRSREATAYNSPLGRFGPFTLPTALRAAMKILRRIFRWSDHEFTDKDPHLNLPSADKGGKQAACFDYQIGLCPGTCVGAILAADYRKNIQQLIRFFRGEKKKIVSELRREMKSASKDLRYEEAAEIRGRLFTLEHIHDVALIDGGATFGDVISKGWGRVEGYDISNISGAFAVGAMVVFVNGASDKNEYRKFKIKTVRGANDVAMLAEVLRRRFARIEWPMPDVILVDGGAPQVNVARGVLVDLKLEIPVIGIAKGPTRKRSDFLYPLGMQDAIFKSRDMLIRVRDEAHRFAIKYHRELRSSQLL